MSKPEPKKLPTWFVLLAPLWVPLGGVVVLIALLFLVVVNMLIILPCRIVCNWYEMELPDWLRRLELESNCDA